MQQPVRVLLSRLLDNLLLEDLHLFDWFLLKPQAR
jgi:hypothetical protein